MGSPTMTPHAPKAWGVCFWGAVLVAAVQRRTTRAVVRSVGTMAGPEAALSKTLANRFVIG